MSHLEEALPMYTLQPVNTGSSQPPRVTSKLPAHRLFFAFGGLLPTPPQYEQLPTDASEDDPKDDPRAITVLTSSALPSVPTPAPTSYSCSSSPAPESSRVAETIYNIVWYLRMLVYLMLVGAGVATVTSIFGFALSSAVVLGWVAPTNRLPTDAGFTACAAGGPIVGAAVGALGWLHLCILHALAARAAAAVPAIPTFQRVREAAGEDAPHRTQPLYVGVAAAFASVVGLVVGLAVVPALAAVAAESGFSAGLALAMGVWGATVPFVPSLVAAVFTTLSDCDPAAGAECGCGCWFASCTHHG